jgi:hypothetical protein
VACGGGGELTLDAALTALVVKPLKSFSFTQDDTVNHTMTVGSLGDSRVDYGYATGNAALRGHYRMEAQKMIFERTTDSAGAWADHIFIPSDNNSTLKYQLKTMNSVSVKIKAQLNVDAPGLATGCGLVFGFGASAGHSNATAIGANLRIADRDWSLAANSNKTPRDYFRVIWETGKDNERLTIDAPINSYNGGTDWTNYTASQWRESVGEFEVMRNTAIETAGDYVTYRQDIALDVAAGSITVTITPLESNVSMSGWQAQTTTWDLTQAVGTLSTGGSARSGLDLTNITGSAAMSLADLAEQYVVLGFVGNLAPRLCEFSDFKIYKRAN